MRKFHLLPHMRIAHEPVFSLAPIGGEGGGEGADVAIRQGRRFMERSQAAKPQHPTAAKAGVPDAGFTSSASSACRRS
jgi:hypothetical protein